MFTIYYRYTCRRQSTGPWIQTTFEVSKHGISHHGRSQRLTMLAFHSLQHSSHPLHDLAARHRFLIEFCSSRNAVHVLSRRRMHKLTATPCRIILPGRFPSQPVRSRSMGAARDLASSLEGGKILLIPSCSSLAALLTTPLHSQQA